MRHLFTGLICVLIGVGIQMVHSSSLTSMPGQRETVFLSKHLTYLMFAVCCGFAASRVSAELLKTNAWRFFWILVVLLVAVLIPGIGTRINGAQRWLRIGSLSLQPSELGRLVLPLVAARIVTELKFGQGFRLKSVPWTLLPLALTLPLVAKEPDLGATVFLAAGFLIALFIGGWPLRYFVGSAMLIAPAALSLLALKSYQMKRITGFMEAWQDISRAPWQIRQSLLSLGAGGLEGAGIGGGWQKLSYLPEANTDFVFAVIGEELGLAGTLAVVVIWMGVFLTGRAALRNLRRDSFEWIYGSTLVIQMVLQALANVAVVTAMVPPKGVPHPFISYGGTNLLVNITAVGLITGLSRHGAADGKTKTSTISDDDVHPEDAIHTDDEPAVRETPSSSTDDAAVTGTMQRQCP
ncbi:MAG: FtsW/RodA/SpoVE family cell cycle protein [Planctomycetaceae bacterium]|nr:FtsW/RodA/SpoVE family cell cycle protein [Planctomycetaceae bacterium]